MTVSERASATSPVSSFVTDEERSLVANYGSPLYVYRLDRVGQALADLRASLPDESRLYYSLKANPHPEVARHLAAGGCDAEVSSAGELDAALAAGFPARGVLFTGPAKSPWAIRCALAGGVRLFSVESRADLGRLGEAGVATECLLRVSRTPAGSSGLRMTGATQFGIDIGELAARPEDYVGHGRARVIGVHFFPMSNARSEVSLIAEFTSSIKVAARLRELGVPLGVVDLGGGFAAPYAKDGTRLRYDRLRASLEAALDESLPGWRYGAPSVAFESGRYLTGDSGSLLCTVMDVKQRMNETIVVLDTGIHHLGGLSGIGRLLRPEATVRVAVTTQQSAATLTGPLCTPADVLGRNVPTPPVAIGDLVAFPNVGAYGLTASLLGFLSHPAPTEVVLDADGVVISATRLRVMRVAHETQEGSGR
jgi:diaminopimelate decarboxylase